MTYEIPSQLEYKERIMFGLTFEQLIYAGTFGTPALFILLKISFNDYIKWTLILALLMFGISFMFFDLKTYLKNWFVFLKQRDITDDSNNMIDFLEVRQIKDGILKTKKQKISILKVEPVNFSIKTEEEKNILTGSFRKMLNSLDFPVQILIDTVPVELKEYLSVLRSKVKEHSELFEEYSSHLADIIHDGRIMTRNFYLIIPEKDDLSIQTELCEDRIKSINLRARRLNDQRIANVISKFFDGDRITYCPEKIENQVNHLKVNNKYNRIVAVTGYPRIVESGFLDRIVTAKGDFDISIHIEPYDIQRLMVMLNKELQKQRADLYAAELKNMINPSLEIKYKDTRKILENLQKGNEKMFYVSLYVNCRADSIEDLNLLTKKVMSELNSVMMIPKIPHFRMIEGFKSVAPLAVDKLDYKRNITSDALSAFFPFTSPFLQVDKSGIWFGLNKNSIPVIRDVFSLSNPNGCVLASSGSGKSYLAKLLITRHLLNGTKVIVIDPQSEYKEVAKRFGGEVISLKRTSKTMINPLDLMGHEYAEKRLSLMDLMKVMLGDLSEPQKSIIDKALTIVYEKKGNFK